MVRFEIFNATHRWRNCDDMRPWLVIELRPRDIVGCFPISGECYGSDCFPIESTHPSFPATGLKKSCFVIDTHIIEIPFQAFKQRRGALTNQLLAEFCEYSSLAP